ncbi:hypothetical protein FRC08_016397 [Ceratobasidium sp. 394]|nr:hypothetical protein FRC08_016397 [Ceratobasidium sp. 394]
MQAPVNQVQPSAQVRLRIQSIEVGFTTCPQYPINLKLLSNGRLLFNLQAIKSGQPPRWESVNPIDVDQSGSIEIRVYELHWFGKKREPMGAVSFKVHDIVNRGSGITARDDSGSLPFSVSVVSTVDVGRSAAQNGQKAANELVAMSPSLLESMGRTRDAVETILKIGQSLAELNPIAKASVGLFTQAWEVSRPQSTAEQKRTPGLCRRVVPDRHNPSWQTLKKQDQCDALVAKLVAEMGDVLPHVAAVEDHAKLANLQDTLKDPLLLVEDASRFVIEYKSDGATVRAVKAFVSSSAQGQVDEFVDRFRKLKENFDRGMATQLVQRVETLFGDGEYSEASAAGHA